MLFCSNVSFIREIRLIINEHFNPQAYPYVEVISYLPIHSYVDENGVERDLPEEIVHTPHRSKGEISNDNTVAALEWYTHKVVEHTMSGEFCSRLIKLEKWLVESEMVPVRLLQERLSQYAIESGGLRFFSDITLLLIDEAHPSNNPRGAALEATDCSANQSGTI
ncbi:hypothetical protein VNO78_21679 [Psophocarpus tetragonolobus]|uniref:Uncharacterized protein n=1 Tax=Psophocarpus tetragonolobus TaxID=3891 RepID=A0AAN9XI93_PSOTE